MRHEPKPAEDASITALVNAFRRDGHTALRIPRRIEDKPDALLEIGGVRIACECIQVPPEYIYKHHHIRHQPSAWGGKEILSFLWPNEPHQWVAEAVTRKARLWPSYQALTDARAAWLLIHSPIEPNQFFLDGAEKWIQWALRHGAKMNEHPFDQVFLWTPGTGIHTISVARNETGTHSELGISFSEGYPTLCVNRFTIPFVTQPTGSKAPLRTRYMAQTIREIVVQPRDIEYARHQPARRLFYYTCDVLAWEKRADIQTTVSFADEADPITLDCHHIENLSPNTSYFEHNIHEFRAPKSLKTWHVVQPH